MPGLVDGVDARLPLHMPDEDALDDDVCSVELPLESCVHIFGRERADEVGLIELTRGRLTSTRGRGRGRMSDCNCEYSGYDKGG